MSEFAAIGNKERRSQVECRRRPAHRLHVGAKTDRCAMGERTLASVPRAVIEPRLLPAIGHGRRFVAEAILPVRDPPAVIAVDEHGSRRRETRGRDEQQAPGKETRFHFGARSAAPIRYQGSICGLSEAGRRWKCGLIFATRRVATINGRPGVAETTRLAENAESTSTGPNSGLGVPRTMCRDSSMPV